MIDAHQHFWKYDPARHEWITDEMRAIRRDFQPEDLRPLLEKNHIEGSVVVQVDQTEDETLSLVAMANQCDFIRGVVGWIDLQNTNLESRLEYFSSLKKLRGFRHIVQGEPAGFLAQPSFIQGVRKLQAFEFTYDLLVYHHQLAEAIRFVSSVPDTRIVIDHLAKPSIITGELVEWEKQMRKMATFPNVSCKVSGMVTEGRRTGWKPSDFTRYLDVVFEAFGTDRLIYGSDWPVCLVAASYDEQFSIARDYLNQFSAREKKNVLGDNAKRFYNL